MIEDILEAFSNEVFLKADGFDNAIIGVDEGSMRLIYSESKCIEVLQTEHGMNLIDAIEHFDFNIKGAYLGEKTPIWCSDIF
jgi:hypothetical protein